MLMENNCQAKKPPCSKLSACDTDPIALRLQQRLTVAQAKDPPPANRSFISKLIPYTSVQTKFTARAKLSSYASSGVAFLTCWRQNSQPLGEVCRYNIRHG